MHKLIGGVGTIGYMPVLWQLDETIGLKLGTQTHFFSEAPVHAGSHLNQFHKLD
jgi:hypothetical protein